MKKIHSAFKKLYVYGMAHKVVSAIAIIILVLIGYYSYEHFLAPKAVPQYAVSVAHFGTLTQDVTGSGQVYALNQTDVKSQVSGTIETIDVSVGQHVSTGDLIATIDPTNALASLASAKLSLAKLVEPAKAADVTNAQNSLNTSYNSGFNAVSTSFLDLPAVISGM